MLNQIKKIEYFSPTHELSISSQFLTQTVKVVYTFRKNLSNWTFLQMSKS